MQPDSTLLFQPSPAIRPGQRTRALPEVSLSEVGIHALSEAECVRYVLDRLEEAQGGWMITQDLDHLRLMVRDHAFRELCEQADLRVPDGRVTLWACHLQRTPVPEAVSGPSLIWSLSRGAGDRGRSIFLLGGRPGTARRAADELDRTFEGLDVRGWSEAGAGLADDPVGMKKLAHELDRLRPDIVFVGLDAPDCERIVSQLRSSLPGAWWLGVGVSFSFVSGEFRRAPVWMRGCGLEWLHRLWLEPRRLFVRSLFQGIPFGLSLLSRCTLRGVLPKPKQVGTFGTRRPRALIVDDDPFALNHLEMLLHESFPDLEIEKRTEANVDGLFDFYFLDNQFDGQPFAGTMARKIRSMRPEARIFAFSGSLDVDALKGLINAGCDGVCDKDRPESWQDSLRIMRDILEDMAQKHRHEKRAFGGVRHAAGSIHGLLREWNERDRPAVELDVPAVPDGVDMTRAAPRRGEGR